MNRNERKMIKLIREEYSNRIVELFRENVRDIFDSPTDKMVEIFGLNRINGPNKLPDGSILPLSNPGHPSNVFKNVF